jgi:hypothetical protein
MFKFPCCFRFRWRLGTKDSNSSSIHPLVHSWARERLTPMKGQEVAAVILRIDCLRSERYKVTRR